MPRSGGIFEGGQGWLNDWENEKDEREEEPANGAKLNGHIKHTAAELAAEAIKHTNGQSKKEEEEEKKGQQDLFQHESHEKYPD
ncbi:MAG TPA: hypothetical protein VHF05_02435 [Candidatus Paceibacterota bacterium]|jgi:hypothetical protein|nr:hypothetical protein [Candidatus Paceibacterota bacterium]